MSITQQAVLFLHLVSAIVWVGGNLFLSLNGPAVRDYGTPKEVEALRLMGLRFRVISWAALVVLVATGFGNLYFTGRLRHLAERLAGEPFLATKLAIVVVMIAVKILHDFVVGPRAAKQPDDPLLWRTAMVLGRGNTILGVIVIYFAMRVAHG